MTKPEPPPLTAQALEKILESRYFRVGKRSITVPNVTALGHESDFLVLTGARYLLEIEIKVSIADFRNDLRGSPLSPKWARQEIMRAAAAGEPIPVAWRTRGMWRDLEVIGVITDPAEALEEVGQGRARFAPVCPNRFAYAYPEELHATIEAEAPAWAGLMPYARSGHRARGHGASWYAEPIERAPRLLHREKAPDAVRDDMLFSTYHRFWNERRARIGAQESVRHLSDQLVEARA